MNPSDYRLLLESVYGEWKRSHTQFLDLVAQIACGGRVPPAIVATVRADVERAMDDLSCISHQCMDEQEIVPGKDVSSRNRAMFGPQALTASAWSS